MGSKSRRCSAWCHDVADRRRKCFVDLYNANAMNFVDGAVAYQIYREGGSPAVMHKKALGNLKGRRALGDLRTYPNTIELQMRAK